MAKILVIRIRGSMETREKVEQTLKQMRLTRKNHATLVEEKPQTKGSLNFAKDFITWGPATEQTIALLLGKRGRVEGNRPLTDEYVAENSDSKYKSIAGFAAALAGTGSKDGKDEKLSAIKGLKQLFRLNPPKGGFGSIKTAFPKGSLGPRKAEQIAALVEKMV